MADRTETRAPLAFAAACDVRDVDRDNGRHLGAAVALEQIETELFLERLGDRLAQLLRAHNGIAQVRELFRRALADVRPAECRRADEHRRAVAARELANRLRIGRIRVVHDGESADERQPDRSREAERVEEWQHPHEDVVIFQLVYLKNGVDVREDVPVRQHHPFGDAGAAAGENHGRYAFRIAVGGVQPAQHARREDERGDEHSNCRERVELLQHVFNEQHSRGRLEAKFRNKRARRKDRRDAAPLDRGGHGILAGGEIQVDGHFAGERRGHVRERASNRRGQQQSDVGFVLQAAAHPAREQQASDKTAPEGEPLPG